MISNTRLKLLRRNDVICSLLFQLFHGLIRNTLLLCVVRSYHWLWRQGLSWHPLLCLRCLLLYWRHDLLWFRCRLGCCHNLFFYNFYWRWRLFLCRCWLLRSILVLRHGLLRLRLRLRLWLIRWFHWWESRVLL